MAVPSPNRDELSHAHLPQDEEVSRINRRRCHPSTEGGPNEWAAWGSNPEPADTKRRRGQPARCQLRSPTWSKVVRDHRGLTTAGQLSLHVHHAQITSVGKC